MAATNPLSPATIIDLGRTGCIFLMQINRSARVEANLKTDPTGPVIETVEDFMRVVPLAVGLLAAVAATPVSAQSVNLSGKYICTQMCRTGLVGNPAYITQNGPQLNLLNEAGEPSRAWPDWFAPATRIWIERYNYGAVYSPDGMFIQFDNGTIWARDLGLPPPMRRRG